MTTLEMLVHPTTAAVITGLLAFISGYQIKRVEKAPDVQASLNAAVAGVIAHYTAALKSAEGEMREMRDEIRALRETIGELEDHVDALTSALDKAGVAPPPRRRKPTEKAA